MDVIYRLQGVEFEGDENKARNNVQKHGVTFFDPLHSLGDASVPGE
jgi:uncharacterized protein